jgi:NADPH2:quinone reductase
MTIETTRLALQLRSLVRRSGELELSLASVAIPEPAPGEVLVRVEASPINPSDQGLLFGAADMSTARFHGTASHPIVTASIPAEAMKHMAGRLDESLPVGNEGAGVVVQAGSSAAAQALLGQTVALLGGAMYAQYRCISVEQCLVLPAGITPADGASAFINPLTVLGMVETMRREGHTALVHTAAASNLGQMLNRVCLEDHIGLVNIVRKQEHEDLLRAQGAPAVCNTTSPTFMADLVDALVATGATIAFDATGGGRLAGQILTGMEAALNKTARVYSRYGSTTHKQVYLYGRLDPSPTELAGNFGMAWGMGGWLVFPFMEKIGPAAAQQMRDRVAAHLKTTFASHYVRTVSLAEMLQPEAIAAYGQRATNAKYLLNPNKGLTAQE